MVERIEHDKDRILGHSLRECKLPDALGKSRKQVKVARWHGMRSYVAVAREPVGLAVFDTYGCTGRDLGGWMEE